MRWGDVGTDVREASPMALLQLPERRTEDMTDTSDITNTKIILKTELLRRATVEAERRGMAVDRIVNAALADRYDDEVDDLTAELRNWAETRKASANQEYQHNGRGGYGDIAGAIEVCDEIIDWCDEHEQPTL